MEERIDKLEAVIDNFMNNWGPEVQEARSRRDEVGRDGQSCQHTEEK